ncbi:hypothetical protein [Lapidilactobacillus wuchangensis]|uniref:hypothetical protein n=1 Tax=Lapidilactobacillus wuchangensis TaxID=2486001 RepID=UPI0013DE5EF9|nr:hypothetical protein [Lapidilactobacillus wuchangensis]
MTNPDHFLVERGRGLAIFMAWSARTVDLKLKLVLGRKADNSVAVGGLWNVTGIDLSLLRCNNLKYNPSSNR